MAESPDTPQVSPNVGSPATGAHGLGPHVVGQRVVVRRLLPGETGPTGGPAMTDTLGECLSWGRGLCEVRTADGTVVTIHLADIVSGKPVPPRPSVRLRVPPRELHLRSDAWPSTEHEELGEWVLRATGLVPDAQHPQGRLVRRANSALAIGDPGMPTVQAAERVRDFYAQRGQAAYATAVVDDVVDRELADLGWGLDPVGEVLVQVVAVSRAVRQLRGRATAYDVSLDEEELGAEVARAALRLGEEASLRAHLDGDVVTLHDLLVAPEHRRRGLARAVVAEALDWAASRGATTAQVQVTASNAPAVQLWGAAGFSTHHAYRYRVAD
ncbi:GNAT family N-acetyltransferase [Nocardioides daphniae]|uniref:N-acetyltransferase n=1 Tax=Nocardioides daphniae TaxID=402297 RepID=A0A4P7U998_9ACTN|nr:GNAT family N-acetyltransferase [Nocardioides daphniae]QCC76662.1 GNAT family N-acetyltransferase [Nocardioides daphniae]GGD15143.1 N-acetyltransferase [Nocardioides daphniae]